MSDKASVLADVCAALSENQPDTARERLRDDYPFDPIEPTTRSYSEYQMTDVFVRDGFIDRYTGRRLVFPAALRLISERLPNAFPYHPHGKMSACHMAYWELLPTVDHVVPVTRGGADAMDNWVTTSMRRNGMKANWTLEELDWSLAEPGELGDWDGLLGWFMDETDQQPELLDDSAYFRRWRRAGARHIDRLR